MSDVIIDPGNGLRYLPQPNTPDMAYRFVRGSEIWACLFQYPNDFSLDEAPAVFRSTDNGASWGLQNSAGAPISNKIGPTTVTYDSRFNYLSTVSQPSITFVYAEEPSTPTLTYRTCDFSFGSGSGGSYGSPYGTFTVDRPEGELCFSSRPDGTLVVFYDRQDSGGTILGVFYRIYASGSWGGENTLVSGVVKMSNLAVDGAGNSHIILQNGNYYRMDSSDAIVAGPTAVSSGANGNLTISGASLLLAYRSGSDIRLATGTPVASPSWSNELVAAGAGAAGTVNALWTQQINGTYAITLEVEIGSPTDYTVDAKPFTASGLTVSWFTSDQQHIKQSVRTSGVWSTPSTIWTASPTAGNLFSLAIRGGGGAPSNRSFPR